VEDIVFKSPVLVGSLVIVRAKLSFTSRSSMEIRVDVEMERGEEKTPALTASFVMVALDAKGKPTSIPELILLTEEEESLFAEAQARYKSRKK
jgi:acyl-CoA hydrolase